jgi:hypothetical protein
MDTKIKSNEILRDDIEKNLKFKMYQKQNK